VVGERLFLETRFAEFFATHMTGINQPLSAGDPVVATVQTTSGTLPGPFAGQSINCRSCHFVVEFEGVSGAGNRTYADFTTRSPLPLMINGFDHTPRNAEQMVGSLIARSGPTFLHFDGEFNNTIDLIESTMTGRNFGWSHPNATEAFRHIAVAGQPQFADLGLWNVYLNPDMPNPQSDLASVVCAPGNDCSVDQGLASTIAQFKTPGLRDLADSNPYFHNGSKLTFQDVVNFYVFNSQLARQGNLRNAPSQFQSMSIDQTDVSALVAFLQSLTQDYDDTHLPAQ